MRLCTICIPCMELPGFPKERGFCPPPSFIPSSDATARDRKSKTPERNHSVGGLCEARPDANCYLAGSIVTASGTLGKSHRVRWRPVVGKVVCYVPLPCSKVIKRGDNLCHKPADDTIAARQGYPDIGQIFWDFGESTNRKIFKSRFYCSSERTLRARKA
jgi:hypothetical protein